jgi:hypothetical protein
MERTLITCGGSVVGSLRLPAFTLKTRGFVCLHLPGAVDSEGSRRVAQVLAGERTAAGLEVTARVCRAAPPTQRAGLLGLVRRPRAVDWLRRSGHLTRAQAEAVVTRLVHAADGRVEHLRVGQLPGTPRVLLGLEAAWARAAEVVLFTTAGLDPLGRRMVYQAVAARLPQCAAVHFSHEYTTQGRWERDCYEGASCVEVGDLLGVQAFGFPA